MVALCGLAGPAHGKPAAKELPRIDPAQFRAGTDNPYLPLVPGTTMRYIETLGRHVSQIEITVTDSIREVMGVRCVVVHEKVWEKDRLSQETRTWLAPDAHGNVWVFGEDACEFLAHRRVSREGSWEAGVDGAKAGIAMPADPHPGEPYRMSFAANMAEDVGQVIAVGDSVTVPFGTFGGCVATHEWSMLESGTDKKWYAPGLGLVRARSAAREELVLLSVVKR